MNPNPSKCTKHTTESHRKYLPIGEFCSVLCNASIAITAHSPAGDSEERADAWVPSERAVRGERRNMQAARGERKDQ